MTKKVSEKFYIDHRLSFSHFNYTSLKAGDIDRLDLLFNSITSLLYSNNS